jgi:hypothetical protein
VVHFPLVGMSDRVYLHFRHMRDVQPRIAGVVVAVHVRERDEGLALLGGRDMSGSAPAKLSELGEITVQAKYEPESLPVPEQVPITINYTRRDATGREKIIASVQGVITSLTPGGIETDDPFAEITVTPTEITSGP